MIFHDKVTVMTPGGRDPKGYPLPDVILGTFPAQVNPIRSTESIERGVPPLMAYYRLVIGKTAGKQMSLESKVIWHGRKFSIEGDMEQWRVNNRLHHYEATLKS